MPGSPKQQFGLYPFAAGQVNRLIAERSHFTTMAIDLAEVTDQELPARNDLIETDVEVVSRHDVCDSRLRVSRAQVLVDQPIYHARREAEHLIFREAPHVGSKVFGLARRAHPLGRTIDPCDATRAMREAKVQKVVCGSPRSHDSDALASQIVRTAQCRGVIFGDRRIDPLDLRNYGTIVASGRGDEKLRTVDGRIRGHAPTTCTRPRANDGSIQANKWRELEALRPGLYIVQNARLILPG